jgi:hypothetical protein
MSNYLDFSVKTREQFKTWILTMLGSPLITIELHDEQLEVAINNAVEEYTKFIAQEQEYMSLDLRYYVQDVGFTLPGNVTGVFTLYDQDINSQSVNMLFSVPNAMWNAGMWPTMLGGGAMSGGSWINYEVAMQYVELSRRMVGGGFQFEFNPRTQQLKLYPDPTRETLQGWLIIGVYTIRPEVQQYGESWCRRYALAVAKEMLGRVRSKFSGVQLLGGGTVDTSVLEEGRSEQVALKEELKGEQMPYSFFMGGAVIAPLIGLLCNLLC